MSNDKLIDLEISNDKEHGINSYMQGIKVKTKRCRSK